MDRIPVSGHAPYEGEFQRNTSLTAAEAEVRLAIAEYIIKRVNGTDTGREIFEALVPRFEDKYPHHKLLTQCLISPGHLDPEYLE